MAEPETPATPLAEALARVGDRWTLLVVEALLAGPTAAIDEDEAREGGGAGGAPPPHGAQTFLA
jgi:hypothetical protein